jgi:hypothetical protein
MSEPIADPFAEAIQTSYCKHCGKRIWFLDLRPGPYWAEDEMSVWNSYCPEDDSGESQEHEPHSEHTQPWPIRTIS